MAEIHDVVDLLFKRIDEQPNQLAVCCHGYPDFTYVEFGCLVRRLAATLSRYGPGARVLIHLPQGPYAYASMFATLLAGGYYSPVNLASPIKRVQKIINIFNPNVIISDTPLDSLYELDSTRVLLLDCISDNELSDAAEPHDLAYVIFTSGSTGEPKGVMIPRVGLSHYINWAISAYGITKFDKWSQHPNIAFDLSVLDIFGVLCGGACLYPVVSQRDRLLLGDFIRNNHLTVWNSVPSVIDLIRRANQLTAEHLGSLRIMTFCGEPLLASQVKAIFLARPDIKVINTYGPTEATVACTIVQLTAQNWTGHAASSISIGNPIPGMTLRLDTENDTCEGEIVLSGPQVARGYWNNAESTAQFFSFSQGAGDYPDTYKTGDFGRYIDHNLYFLCRKDRQIKVNGYRLELGEIDSAARRVPGVYSATTIFHDGKLICFIVSEKDDDKLVSLAAIKAELQTALPSYAMPHEIRHVKYIPLSTNDKIDYAALLEQVWK